MYNLALVEDDDSEANVLASHIQKYFVEHGIEYKLTRFDCTAKFLFEYRKVYDIVFMDIMLPDMNGIEAASKLREVDEGVTLIFVTNMANLAVRGYEVSALDFIIKPVEYDSFAMRMNRAIKAVRKRKSVDISIQTERAVKVVSASDIYYVEVSRHILVYHTSSGVFSSRGALDAVERRLSDESFVRCNICYLVNLKYVTKVEGENLEIAGDVLKISRARKKSFMLALANFLGNTN